MKKDYCVYEHIFPDGSKYVGITHQEPSKRWGTNGSQYKKQPVYEAIQKFGWENVQHIILAQNLTQEQAREYEQQIIKAENLEKKGWNRHKGGGVGGNSIPMFEYNGQLLTPDELVEYATAKNLTSHDLTNRINEHGWDIETALSKEKVLKGRTYLYQGQQYTAKELAQLSPIKGMTTGRLLTRLNRNHWDVERALTQPLNVKRQPKGIGDRIYEYNGNFYNSYELTQISPIDDLDIADITCRINKHGWSVERAITTPKKKMNLSFEYQGKIYDSHELAKIALDHTMTYHDVTDRARMGWSTWEIVNIPKGQTRKQYYKTQE